MNISPIWLSSEVQARIEPPSIPLIKKKTDNMIGCDIIKINMRRNLSDADSEMYKLNIVTFEHGQPEEFFALMKNFNRVVDGTGTMPVVCKKNYLGTILRGEALQ